MQKWLYDIVERRNALQAVFDEAMDKSIEEGVKNALATMYESDVPQAVADGIEYIKKQEELIAGVEKREKEYKEYKDYLKRRLERVKRGYTDFLVSMDAKRVETPSGKMTVAAPTFSTVIDSIDDLPDDYKRTTIKVEADKTAIKQAIQGGHTVKGAHLEEKISIRIK